MQIVLNIPTLEQLSQFQTWDQTVGIFLAIVLAGLIGAYFVLSQLMSGFMGGHRINGGWMFMNIVIGFLLSIATLSITGSWLAGCGVAVACWFVLASIREKFGG